MRFKGHCQCGNIEIAWSLIDTSLVPRACQCSYCLAKGAAYLSKNGSNVEVTIAKQDLHKIHLQGDHIAQFHECGFCKDLVFVSAMINDQQYCAINYHNLDKREQFPEPIPSDFTALSKEQSLERWQQHWCNLKWIEYKEKGKA